MINQLERIIHTQEQKLLDMKSQQESMQRHIDMERDVIEELQQQNESLKRELEQGQDLKLQCKIKDEQIEQLKGQILGRQNADQLRNLKNYEQFTIELQEQLDQVKRRLNNSEMEKENLKEELAKKNVVQVVHLKSDAEELLQNYKQYVQQQQEGREKLNAEIGKQNRQIEKLNQENKNLLKKLENLHKELEYKIEKSELRSKENKQMADAYREQNEMLIESKLEYERQRLEYEQRMQGIIRERDQLIQNQNNQLEQLQHKVNQSNTFVVDTLNNLLPSHLDEYIESKRELLNVKKECLNLKEIAKQLEISNTQLQQTITEQLPFVKEHKKDFDQLQKNSQLQRKRLEEELKLTQKLRNKLTNSEQYKEQLLQQMNCREQELIKTKRENTILLNLVAKLKEFIPSDQDRSFYSVEFFISQEGNEISQLNQDRQSLIQRVIHLEQMQNNEIQRSFNTKEMETLQNRILQLQRDLALKEEELNNCQEEMNVLQHQLGVQQTISQQNVPIIHKIDKIQVKNSSKKWVQTIQKLKNAQIKFDNINYELQTSIFEQQKLRGQFEYEKQQRLFVQQNFDKLNQEVIRLRQMIKERNQQLQQIEVNTKPNQYHFIQNEYLNQNKLLFEQIKENEQLIAKQQQQIEELTVQQFNQTISPQQQRDNQEIFLLKIQQDNQYIIIKNYEQQLQELRKTQQNSITYENQFQEMQNFTKQYKYANDDNNFENVQELKDTLHQLQKKCQEQNERYCQCLDTMKNEFKIQQDFKDKQIQEFQEQQECYVTELKRFQELYEEAKLEVQSRCNLSNEELEGLKRQLDQEILQKQELQQLLNKNKLEQNNVYQQQQQLKIDQDLLVNQKKLINNEYQALKNIELAITTNDYVLRRQIDDLLQKLAFEQQKLTKFFGYEPKEEEDIILNNQRNQQAYMIEQQNITLMSQQLNQDCSNFEEEKRHYLSQIEQLNHLRDGITVDDVLLVRDLIQDGRLLLYLEKAKQIYNMDQ